jgi:catechol 2,3-dioxygenase-like lactoylglutathione lyase family enzyme
MKPIKLLNGHYECRSLAETIPVLSEILAFEVVMEGKSEVTLKHPNTDWLLIAHESGRNIPDKPVRHHYGVRVATNEDVDRAYDYLQNHAEKFHISMDKPTSYHLAYRFHFLEPGGNWWEIESYESAVKAGLGANVSVPWKKPLPAERFPGKGYIPQALSHGTIECYDLAESNKFYIGVLGLEIVTPLPNSKPCHIKHPSDPWYVVSLPHDEKPPSSRLERFTVLLESDSAVREANRHLKEHGRELRVTALEDIREGSSNLSFLLSDLDGNWWEIASPSKTASV